MPITATFEINVSGRSVVMSLLGHGADITLRPCATRADAERVAKQIRKQLEPYATMVDAIDSLDRCRVTLVATLIDDADFQEFLQSNYITVERSEAGAAMEFTFVGAHDALRDMIKSWFATGDKEYDLEMYQSIQKVENE